MNRRHANYVEIYERSEINFTTELSTPAPVLLRITPRSAPAE